MTEHATVYSYEDDAFHAVCSHHPEVWVGTTYRTVDDGVVTPAYYNALTDARSHDAREHPVASDSAGI